MRPAEHPAHHKATRAALILATAVVTVLPGAGGVAQEQRPGAVVFRSNVIQRTVHVLAQDARGQPVLGLEAADFRVVEGGQEREVTVVLPPGDTGIDVVLALDHSSSMQRSAVEARDAALRLLDSLRPSDCVYFLPFNDNVGPGMWGAPDDDSVRRRIRVASFTDGTALFDGVIESYAALAALTLSRNGDVPFEELPEIGGLPTAQLFKFRRVLRAVFENREQRRGSCAGLGVRRQALVLVTDGHDTASEANLSDALVAAAFSNVPTYAVGVLHGSARRRPSGPVWRRESDYATYRGISETTLEDALRPLVEASAGALLKSGAVEDGFAALVRTLDSYYVLAYRSDRVQSDVNDLVDVSVREPGVEVLARAGYFGGLFMDESTAVEMLLRGYDLMATGNDAAALAAFDDAVRIDHRAAAAHHARAVLLERQGRLEEALQAADQARYHAPWLAEAAIVAVRMARRLEVPSSDLWERVVAAVHLAPDRHDELVGEAAAHPLPADLDARLSVARVFIGQPRVPDLRAQGLLQELMSALGRAIDAHRGMALAATAEQADVVVFAGLETASPDGAVIAADVEMFAAGGGYLGRVELQLPDSAAAPLARDGGTAHDAIEAQTAALVENISEQLERDIFRARRR